MVVKVEMELFGALSAARAAGDAEFARSCELSGVGEMLPSAPYAPDVEDADGMEESLLDKMSRMVNDTRIPIEQARLLRLYAAWKGHLYSQFNLAYNFSEGRNVQQDCALARYWYTKAARAGLASAQNNLGMLYSEGRGGPVDKKRAVFWLMKSAMNGCDLAKSNLGEHIMKGEGVSRDYHRAAALLKDYVARHPYNARAHFMLAECHERIGGERRLRLAARHYQEASDFGSVSARAALKRLLNAPPPPAPPPAAGPRCVQLSFPHF